MPVEKKPGDRVTGGKVNATGGFVFRAEKSGPIQCKVGSSGCGETRHDR